jgi:hypothetical protein
MILDVLSNLNLPNSHLCEAVLEGKVLFDQIPRDQFRGDFHLKIRRQSLCP